MSRKPKVWNSRKICKFLKIVSFFSFKNLTSHYMRIFDIKFIIRFPVIYVPLNYSECHSTQEESSSLYCMKRAVKPIKSRLTSRQIKLIIDYQIRNFKISHKI